jgi:hypothetical protein
MNHPALPAILLIFGFACGLPARAGEPLPATSAAPVSEAVAVVPETGPDQQGPPAPDDAAPAATPRQRFRAISRREAEARGLPPAIADAVMHVESDYNPAARGGAGEVGLMQVMPPTARLLGFSGTREQLADPETNIRLGVRYLARAWQLAGGDVCTAAMKYRAGHGETRFSVKSVDYCRRIRIHLASIGYPVTGELPVATFGFNDRGPRWGFGLGSVGATRRLYSGRKLKSRAKWGAYDARMKQLTAQGRIGLGL